jgi:hypothetical protein
MDSSSGRVKAYGEAGQTGVGGNYSLLVAQRLPIPAAPGVVNVASSRNFR